MDTPEKELLNPEEKVDFESIYADIYDEFGEKSESENTKPLIEEPAESDNTYADKQKKAPAMKKDHSIRNLTILIILELLGIAGVAAWWILRLL